MQKYFYVTVLVKGIYYPIIGPVSRREIAETLVRVCKLFVLKYSSECAFALFGVSKFQSETEVETLAQRHAEDFKKFISTHADQNELRLMAQEEVI